MSVEDLVVTGHRPPLKVGDCVSYTVDGRKVRGEVVTYRAIGDCRDLQVRLDHGPLDRLLMMPSGRVLEPVSLARRVFGGSQVHDVPVTEVERCLAFAVLLRAGEWTGGESR